MSSRSSRLSPSASTPIQHASKLPRFLQKQGRDRSKSVNDQGSADGSIASSSSSSILDTPSAKQRSPESRRSSKLRGVKELKEADSSTELVDESMDEPPVIIEPVNIPARVRTRSERPLSASSSESHAGISYFPSSSAQRFSDLPTRLSGWLSHTFSSSSTDLSLPSLLSQSQLSSSPKSKAAGLLTAAKHGKGHLDKAMRYLLDSDATPDRCTDPIWLLGVQHVGYEPPPPPQSPSSSGSGRRSSTDMKRSVSSLRSSASSRTTTPSNSPTDNALSQSQSGKHPGAYWPPVFYADFTSRIWMTYRSHYGPIRDQSLSSLDIEPSGPAVGQSPVSPPKRWNWPVGGEKGWTSDTGWGCMLRTGQSVLANALIHLHLGREWRRPPQPVPTADYATYVRILTWFFDNPDPLCPFSVHRMALAGKELGKDVGQWFGPSTAAGAIKALVNAFPQAGIGVSVATDGVIYESDVVAASIAHPYRQSRIGSPRGRISNNWGQRAVLVLIGVRLGIDGVNPIYYDAVKTLYTFPQSVGIAGGRPSSSYYFVGAQADSLFYLDPHHTRPTIPLRPPPRFYRQPADSPPGSLRDRDYASDREPNKQNHRLSQHVRSGTAPPSFPMPAQPQPLPYHPVYAPGPMQKAISSASQYSYLSSTSGTSSTQESPSFGGAAQLFGGDLDEEKEHYVAAYPAADLKTFHCDRVRKLPMSGLDPSMLIGFLCRDQRDWQDLRARVAELSRKYKAIFSIQDEPPSWPSDSDDMGLESVSDVDVDIDEPSDEFYESPEPDSAGGSTKRQSEDAETEEDPVDPVTPGGASGPRGSLAFSKVDDEDDEGWVAPSVPTPVASDMPVPVVPSGVAVSTSNTSGARSRGSVASKVSKGKARGPPHSTPGVHDPAPTPQEYYPFPVVDDREEDEDGRLADSQATATATAAHRERTTSFARDVRERSEGGGGRSRPTRARDGGRTQSGGVRGIITSDLEDGDGDDF